MKWNSEMDVNASNKLKRIITRIRNSPTELLMNQFTKEYVRSQIEDLDKYVFRYISYFRENHDHKRILWHLAIKKILLHEQPFAYEFSRPAEPAIYDSGNGSPPSFYNAIRDIKENIDKIDAMRFADKQSYDVLAWLLEYRLTGNKLLFFREREPASEQYFDRKYIVYNSRMKGKSVCADLGGFNGDTALQMARMFKQAKIIVFEPDERNFRMLYKRCAANRNIHCIHKGCGSKNNTIYLTGSGDSVHMSDIRDNRSETAEICTLDSEITERIDFLKIDIEGCELDALKGAAGHLTNDRPLLAVCVYHKIEDFHEIYDYLHETVRDYQFALRHYGVGRSEVVLYAVPNNE